MPTRRAYLDWNASAPLLAEARAAMLAALDAGGNASSVHAEGREARRLVEQARADVAALVGGQADRVVFTSGATEAATTLLTPDWRMGRAPLALSHLYVSEADHPCLRNGGRFAADRVSRLRVHADGLADLSALEAALAVHDRDAGLPLVAIHAANNETGVIQPVEAIAAIVRRHGGLFVVDAVQAAGRIPIDIAAGYADFLILSAHKIGGPQGIGAIVGVSDVAMPVPLVTGGGHERGHRAGTENVAGIAGFGAAARVAKSGLDAVGRIGALRDSMRALVLAAFPDARIVGEGAPKLANTLCFAVPGMKAETLQIAFDLAGVALSAGSACSSGKVGPSHVLKAMGDGEDNGALRVSIGATTGEAELEVFAAALAGIAARTRQVREVA